MYEAALRIGAGKVLNTKVLFNSGFDDILIRQRPGHRSDAINVYKPPSCNMLQSVSNTATTKTKLYKHEENVNYFSCIVFH